MVGEKKVAKERFSPFHVFFIVREQKQFSLAKITVLLVKSPFLLLHLNSFSVISTTNRKKAEEREKGHVNIVMMV